MRQYEIDNINKTIILTFSYDKELIFQIKRCDYNARWNPELKQWIIPINDYSKNNILDLIKSFNFQKKGQKEELDVDYSYTYSDVDLAYLRGLCDSKDFAYTPRKYQLECLGYSIDKVAFINGDDVGIGKTFEAILYAEVTNSFPCLVVEPASVKYNWAEKWEEITKGRRSISVIESNKKNDWDSEVVIINYDIIGKKQGTGATVRMPELLSTKWKMVIFDEAHYLKESKSIRSKAAKIIVKGVDKIQLLTGTAIMNKPVEIWNLLTLIGKEKLIADSWMQFVQRYCGGYKGKFGWVKDGATNMLELNRKLRENCYIRREKREVFDEMPSITKQIIEMPITNKKRYKEAVDDLIEFIRKEQGDEKAESAMEAQHLVMINVLRRLSIEGKMKYVQQYLKDWKEAGKGKLVVFGVHREPLEKLSKYFKCPVIQGGVSSKKKQEIVNGFRESKDIFLFANITSGGTGIDGLQHATSNEVIFELPWKPSELDQAIGRVDRSGQVSPVTITFLLNKNTIDQQMWEMLIEKEVMTSGINKGKDIRKGVSGLGSVLRKIMKSSKS